ncbi:hypothetical protein P3T23_006600 [Paraburkholderia sp. GAS448]|uniref:hypothetical protein n=1 Tax=Paraburkholderia sp. GAS448 TaxID=3035136 RepID=UPI003D1EDBAB
MRYSEPSIKFDTTKQASAASAYSRLRDDVAKAAELPRLAATLSPRDYRDHLHGKADDLLPDRQRRRQLPDNNHDGAIAMGVGANLSGIKFLSCLSGSEGGVQCT